MKKVMTFGLAASLLLSLSPAAFAQGSLPANQAVDSLSANETVKTDAGYMRIVESQGDVYFPMDVQLINPVRHTGSSSYERSFTMDPANGEDANVNVKNSGTSTVYLEVTDSSGSTIEASIAAGKQKTVSIYTTKRNSYKVYVYTTDGSRMDINVSARQY
ncbi:hypothetical protein [Paenibacillus medicaginis]|uniref:Uncharacterized protein n=1 Tax=Paenibacillus medicaginis TaxID=1470560 RepID=A0ABV5BXG7_9BACL